MTRFKLIGPALLAAAAVILVTGPAAAQKKPAAKKPTAKKTVIIDVALAAKNADFLAQGEYLGKVRTDDGDEALGVQIIALGGGKFRGVGFHGGLPGAGWDGKDRPFADGVRQGDSIVFKGETAGGTLKDGLLSIHDADGKKIGTLKKTVRKSPTLGAKPPKDAVVLFDGSTPKHFRGGRLQAGCLLQGITSHRTFQDFHMHMEFLLSFMPEARGQGRSNSGCYMQGRYEVQILDSFGLAGKNNECGGIYETRDPAVNMCLPPLSWQTYDVDFTAARFDKTGKKIANARMSVRHNGVMVHDNVELPKGTRGNPVPEGPDPGPIYVQNHGNPLLFRNIWLVEKREAGFKPIFDGKTLTGWHKNPKRIGHGTGGSWTVEDGVISGEQDPPGSGNGGILLTDREFGDFELLIDMKPDWGVCSGLFVRSNGRGQCFQMMVDYHDNGNVGHIYGEGTGGFNTRPFDIFGVYDDAKKLVGLTTKPTATAPPKAHTVSGAGWVGAWKLGDWNTARLKVIGNPPRITTWINGIKVNEFDGNTFPGKGYDKARIAELLGPKGSIAVQVHGGKGWPKGAKCQWRRVFIRELR